MGPALQRLGTLLVLIGPSAGRPTTAPPPPIRLYQTVPPPPSPPPGLIASFDANSAFSVARLGSWSEGQRNNPEVGLVLVQAIGYQVIVYGILSGLTPHANMSFALSEGTCSALAPHASTRMNSVEPDGTLVLEMTHTTNAFGSPVAASSAHNLARSGYAAVYDGAGELTLCAQLETQPNTQVALLGRMPAQYNQRTALGLVVLQRTAKLASSEMHMAGIIHGLEGDFHGMWHFHRGFNCLAATEDLTFYEGIYAGYRTARSSVRGGDEWTYGNYRSDSFGVALVSQTFRLDSPDLISVMSREMAGSQDKCGAMMPPTFIGRQIIVHGRDGSYIGCGTISGYLPGVTDAIAALKKLHTYHGRLDPQALLHINEGPSGVVTMTAVLSGFAPSGDLEIRIHSGFECPGPDAVFAKLYDPVALPDPNTIQTGTPLFVLPAQTNSLGNALLYSIINDTTLNSLAGRVVVVLDKTSLEYELACGIIEPTSWLVATIFPSPSAPSIQGGLVIVAQATSGVALRGTMLTASTFTEGTMSFRPGCGNATELTHGIALTGSGGAWQLTQHIADISVDSLGASDDSGVSLRNAVVKISMNDQFVCGTLLGPLSEIPTPASGICNATEQMRAASIAFVWLGLMVLMLLVSIALLLRPKWVKQFTKTLTDVEHGIEAMYLRRSTSKGSSKNKRYSLANYRDASHSDSALDAQEESFTTVVRPKTSKAARRARSSPDPIAFASTRKPRLLALHGLGANQNVVKRQLRNLGITDDRFTILYLDGPVAAKEPEQGVQDLFDGPFWSWLDLDLDGKDRVLDMLGGVVMFIKQQKIDAVFGFSQGAAVAAVIMQPDVRELLSIHLGARKRRGAADVSRTTATNESASPMRLVEATPPARFGSAMARASSMKTLGTSRRNLVAGGTTQSVRYNANFNLKLVISAHSSDTQIIRRALDLEPQPPPVVIRGYSIHVIGIADPVKPISEASALAFEGGSKRLVAYHPGGHELPRELEMNALLYRRIMAYIAASLTQQADLGMLILKCVRKFQKLSSTFIARQAAERARTITLDVKAVRREKPISFPSEFNCDEGSVYEEEYIDGGKKIRAEHLLMPRDMGRQKATQGRWRPVSKTAAVWVSPMQQLVRVKISEEADKHPLTLRGLLLAQPHDAPCIRSTTTPSRPISYGQLLQFIAPGGKGDLSALSITTRDSVVYVAPGGAVAAVAFITIAAQCTAAPLDPTVMEAEAVDAIEQFKAKHIILFEGAAADGVQAAAKAIKAAGRPMLIHNARINAQDAPGMFELVADPDLPEPQRTALATEADDVVLLLRTSGTTSKPKGVPLQQGAIVRNGLLLSSTIMISEKDVCLNSMPLFHIGGLSASVLATLATGGSVTCLDAFSPDKFAAALAAEPRPTWYSAVPTIHMAVVNHLKDQRVAPDHSLRFIRSGAAALTPVDGEALSSCYGGIPIHSTYSMSEQMPISQPPTGLDQLHKKNGSVGIACAASMAIVDAATLAPQPLGLRGIIAISGPTVMRNYLNNPKADADSYFLLSCADGASPSKSDRFFLTGDVGVLDSDGHLTIKGRSKELIKRGGEQVSPYEVEDALQVHQWVRMPVVFGVPSPAWGEEVGCVLILEPTAPERAHHPKDLLKEMRSACRAKGLAPNKWPSVAAVVSWEELPKTKTNKPIRNGLAAKFGIKPHNVDAQTVAQRGPPRVSRALEGVRYFLACQVVFNHVGIQAPGPGTHMPHVMPDESWGAFGQARFMCIHVPTFFALAGFGMSANMGPAPKSKIGFIAARLSPMYPMYLLSISLLLINMVAMCNPSNFDSNFHWLSQWDDKDRGDFCEPAPLLSGYWESLFATIAIYILGLQSWPLYLFSWFLSYYTWFSSVYYAMLFSHPFFYSPMRNIRGQIKLIWGVTICVVAINYCIVAGWYIGWYSDRTYDGNIFADVLGRRDEEANLTGKISLMYYLFPPFWWPTYALGICAAFLFDHYRPYEKHHKWIWGVITDCISLLLVFCGYIFYPLTSSCMQKEGLLCPSVQPDPTRLALDGNGLDHAFGVGETDALGTRTVAGIWSRFLLPVVVLWLYGLATGEGRTVKLFSFPLLTDTLAPLSYNLYLFHQWVGQMYYLMTRAEWWSYWRFRKSFFWFSPAPVPVAWWEYFYVVLLTTFLSFGLSKIDPWMISKWEAGRRKMRSMLLRKSEHREDLTTLQIILQEVERLTGAQVEPDWTLAECGLSSVAGPVIINMLTTAVPGVMISLADLTDVDTISGLASLLESRKKEMNATGVGTTTTQSRTFAH